MATQKLLEDLRKLKDIPVANEALYKEVSFRCKVSPKQVEECVNVVGKAIADTIKRGAFETIMIPYFGKFRVKTKRVQWMNHSQVMFKVPINKKD